ncbi:MAG: alpha/beta fold hydrolase [Flavobacteriales bacterium]|nr:alpha/beta fold hydrolase [Flavobacteriales bacterium]
MKKVFFSLFLFSSLILLTNCGNSDNQEDTSNKDLKEEVKISTSEETVEINGVKHFIKKMGEGEILLVLHGGPGLFHDYLVPHFQNLAKDYQIVFYDQRGCGKTEFPQDTLSINIETYVEDLEAIRIHLKLDKLNLVGHSWGSLLAVTYAKKYPNNLNRLILVSPAPGNSDYFDQTFTNMQQKRSDADTKELVQTMMSAAFEKREESAFKKAIMLGDKVNLVEQNSITELYKPMNFNENSANNLMLVNSLLERTYFNLNVIEGLEVIKCPTLIVFGDLDNVPFASTQAIHENIKNSNLEIIKKSCHYPFFETPKEFNTVIENFLDPEYEQ